MDYESIIENTKRDVTYTRLSNNLKDQFEKYLASRHEFLRENEDQMKVLFKEIYDLQESNLFFEGDVNEMLDACRFNFVEKEDFNYAGQPRLREIVQTVNEFAKSNLVNIDTNLKAADNLLIVQQYYGQIRDENQHTFQTISITEKNFDPANSIPELKAQFQRIHEHYQKVLRVAQKTRKIQICFSIPDTRLSELILKAEKVEVTKSMLEKHAAACRAFFERIALETDYALGLADADVQPKDNARIKAAVKMFHDFFRNDNNALDQFFTQLYMFRDNMMNNVIDSSVENINLVLKKVQVYRTFIFIKFYTDLIAPEIEKQTNSVRTRLKELFNAPNTKEEFEAIKKTNFRNMVLLNYTKSALVDKGTTPEIFNNSFLNDTIPAIFAKMNEFETQNAAFEREILMIEDIVGLLPEYNKNFELLHRIDFSKTSPQEKIVHNTTLRGFYQWHNMIESAFLGFTDTDSAAYQTTMKLLAERKKVFDRQMEQFFRMPLSYKLPTSNELKIKQEG